MSTCFLSELKAGDSAVIESFSENEISEKLMEMGCLPGEAVKLERIAPLGDPLIISISGYELSLRKAEAATVLVKK
ncbi:MAG: ferrous iron transport protein A [Flavobacteriales bacterium]|nr:MAG: ferrous iron transport protein A [Flavobacteriales bacterium]